MTSSGVASALLVLLVAISVVTSEDSSSESVESFDDGEMREFARRCSPPGVTDDKIDRMRQGDRNLTYGAKCTLACMSKPLGIIIENGKFNVMESKKIVEEHVPDRKILETSFQMLEKCSDIEDEDEYFLNRRTATTAEHE